jgi:hypothetical protein
MSKMGWQLEQILAGAVAKHQFLTWNGLPRRYVIHFLSLLFFFIVGVIDI